MKKKSSYFQNLQKHYVMAQLFTTFILYQLTDIEYYLWQAFRE